MNFKSVSKYSSQGLLTFLTSKIHSLVSGKIRRIKTVKKLPSAKITLINEEYVIALDG